MSFILDQFFVIRRALISTRCACAKDENMESNKDDRQRLSKQIQKLVSTVGTILIYFYFGGQRCAVELNIVPGHTPLSSLHKDFDDMGLNY